MMLLGLDNKDSEKENKWRICAIFLPDVSMGVSTTSLVSTLNLLEPLAKSMYVITGSSPPECINNEKTHIFEVAVRRGNDSSTLENTISFMMMQIKMSLYLCRIAGKIDVVILGAGAFTLILPVLMAKLLRKKVILLHTGLGAIPREAYELVYENTLFGLGKRILPQVVWALMSFNGLLADRIVSFRADVSTPLSRRHADKTVFGASRYYVDVDTFNISKSIEDRENVIGYIGRFEEIKGIMNFVKAIPLLSRELPDYLIKIAGGGSLKQLIEAKIGEVDLKGKALLSGWIPYEEMPQLLNELKLLVIPSYAEVGPHLVFEAMACGTPVLATPVGIMQDVIEDGETGFIMRDNSPECIAQNVVRALGSPRLVEITNNARGLMEKEYTHRAAVEKYRNVLLGLDNK